MCRLWLCERWWWLWWWWSVCVKNIGECGWIFSLCRLVSWKKYRFNPFCSDTYPNLSLMDFLLTPVPAIFSFSWPVYFTAKALSANQFHAWWIATEQNFIKLPTKPAVLQKFPLKEMKVSRWKKAQEMSDDSWSIQITEIWSCQD